MFFSVSFLLRLDLCRHLWSPISTPGCVRSIHEKKGIPCCLGDQGSNWLLLFFFGAFERMTRMRDKVWKKERGESLRKWKPIWSEMAVKPRFTCPESAWALCTCRASPLVWADTIFLCFLAAHQVGL